MNPALVAHGPTTRLRIAICTSARRDASPSYGDTCVIGTAIRKATFQSIGNSGIEVRASNGLIASNVVCITKPICEGGLITLWAQLIVYTSSCCGTVNRNTAEKSRWTCSAIEPEARIRVTIRVHRTRAILISDGSASFEDVAVFKTLGKGICMRWMSIVAINLQTAFDLESGSKNIGETSIVIAGAECSGYSWLS